MVHAFVGTTALPAAYITLPNRKQETYERAWDAVFGSEELSEVTPYSFLTVRIASLQRALLTQSHPPPPALLAHLSTSMCLGF